MKFARLILMASLACFLTSDQVASAQSKWVDFTDDRSRMMFDTDDGEEKDIAIGDIDNDGDEDVVVVRKKPFSVDGERINLLLINQNGVLVDQTMQHIPTFITVPDNARDVQLFDANNNGWLDMVVANTFGSLHRLYVNLGNDKNGNWLGYEDQGSNGEWYSPALPTNPQCCGIAVGDVNGDDLPDLFFVDYLNELDARLFINNGDYTFSDETTTRLSADVQEQDFGTTAFIDDMNGDGFNDIVSNDSRAFGGPGVEIAYNDGSGNFSQTQTFSSTTSPASYMVERADFNNDSRPDLYVVDDGQDYVLFNDSTNANGTINITKVLVSPSILTSFFNGNIRPGDVDNDGWMDMAVSDVDVDIKGCDRRFCLLRNNGGKNLFDPNNDINPIAWNMEGSHDTWFMDINCDGNLDMFMATCTNYHMFVNTEPILLGDVNRDGQISLLDVQPFVDVLSNGTCNAQSDINQDGVTNLLDVDGFVDLLSD